MKKSYEKMTEDELADARIALDEQIAALRAEKKAIQHIVDKRRKAESESPGDATPAKKDPLSSFAGATISGAGGIESDEKVGDNG